MRNCHFKLFFSFFFFFLILLACPAEGSSEGVEEILKKMTLEEKIGQLFIVAAYSNIGDALIENQVMPPIEGVEQMIRQYHIGGVLFKRRWEPLQMVHYINYFQSLSSLPLFIIQDCEWGLAMRQSHTQAFPKNMTLGAVQNLSLIQDLGKEIGRQCRLVGINWNFAPVVDVNSDPRNPVIGKRSFGDDPRQVADRGVAFMKGLQESGILASAKHFPGHGNTHIDSHLSLPVLLQSKEEIERIDLLPFAEMIAAGVKSIMVAHVSVPALDASGAPATLSYPIIQELLRTKMNFDGLIVTDDLIMGAITTQYPGGEAILKAYQAGHDLLLSSRDLPSGFAALLAAVQQGIISQEDLEARVRRILLAKEWVRQQGKNGPPMLTETGDWAQLETEKANLLKRRLFEEAITVVKDPQGSLPLQKNDNWHFVQVGGEGRSPFFQMLKEKIPLQRSFLGADPSKEEVIMLLKKLPPQTSFIVALYPSPDSRRPWGSLSPDVAAGLKALHANNRKNIIVVFDSPYVLRQLEGVEGAILIGYEEDREAQMAAGRVLLGEIPAVGKLPTSVETY